MGITGKIKVGDFTFKLKRHITSHTTYSYHIYFKGEELDRVYLGENITKDCINIFYNENEVMVKGHRKSYGNGSISKGYYGDIEDDLYDYDDYSIRKYNLKTGELVERPKLSLTHKEAKEMFSEFRVNSVENENTL